MVVLVLAYCSSRYWKSTFQNPGILLCSKMTFLFCLCESPYTPPLPPTLVCLEHGGVGVWLVTATMQWVTKGRELTGSEARPFVALGIVVTTNHGGRSPKWCWSVPLFAASFHFMTNGVPLPQRLRRTQRYPAVPPPVPPMPPPPEPPEPDVPVMKALD